MNRINSNYRKTVLEIIGKFKIVPNNLKMIVRAYPELESVKKLNKTYTHLQEEGILEKINCLKYGKRKGNHKDAIKATRKGMVMIQYNKIPFNKLLQQYSLSIDAKQALYYSAEAELFYLSYLNYEKQIEIDEKYINRKTLLEFIKYREGDKNITPIAASRACGILQTANRYFPVYNLQEHNIRVVERAEELMNRYIENAIGMTPEQSSDIVMLSKDISVLRKMIAPNDFEFPKINYGKNEEFCANGYMKKTRYLFIPNAREQAFKKYIIFIGKEEQEKLFNFLPLSKPRENAEGLGTAETLTQKYIVEKIIENGEQLVKKEYPASCCETEENIYFNIAQQEMNELERVYIAIREMRENKMKNETRRVIVFGIETNRIIFDQLYSKFDNVEFKPLDESDLIGTLKNLVEE